MARQRRGGFTAPELRGTLGTLLRTTREVLERGAREGRERLDEVLAGRRRHEALAELGEIVLDLVRRGEIDPEEIPEARQALEHLDEIDAQDQPFHRDERDEARDIAPARRFDARTRAGAADGTVAARGWKPPGPTKTPERVWRPPSRAAAAPAAPPAAAKPFPAAHRGGIAFDDDDLADYMHPDDLPSKTRTDGES